MDYTRPCNASRWLYTRSLYTYTASVSRSSRIQAAFHPMETRISYQCVSHGPASIEVMIILRLTNREWAPDSMSFRTFSINSSAKSSSIPRYRVNTLFERRTTGAGRVSAGLRLNAHWFGESLTEINVVEELLGPFGARLRVPLTLDRAVPGVFQDRIELKVRQRPSYGHQGFYDALGGHAEMLRRGVRPVDGNVHEIARLVLDPLDGAAGLQQLHDVLRYEDPVVLVQTRVY